MSSLLMWTVIVVTIAIYIVAGYYFGTLCVGTPVVTMHSLKTINQVWFTNVFKEQQHAFGKSD